jgi:hypothetical protein
MGDIVAVMERLATALDANQPGGGEHVLIALPSFSVGGSLLDHYAERIPALEHRYLNAHLLLHRIEGCELVFVSCQGPVDEVVEYYTSLVPEHLRESVRARFRTVVVDDPSHRSVAAKLLDRPDLLEELRASFRGRPAFIEPWTVTADEVEVAARLDAPINGTAPSLWPLGFKSAGRKLFRDVGVPVPFGVEDVSSLADVADAIATIREQRPRAPGAIVKLDDSGAGDGNMVIDLSPKVGGDVMEQLRALPESYVEELKEGGVVEERIAGDRFTSPSVQVEIGPRGDVSVLATHEQVIGGDSGQVYTGCRYPADAAYAAELGRHGARVGEALAALGVLGRLSVDFVAAADHDGDWSLYALEVNLRKGGTTHPYAVLRNLVPGRYDVERGEWCAAGGSSRAYCSTDNLVDERWIGLPPGDVISAVADAGLHFDHEAGTGVVLHMLSGLGIDGRFGYTAIGRTPDEAATMEEATRDAVASLVIASGS